MSSETNARPSTDQVEAWKDWNETTIKRWTRTPGSEKGACRDPFGLYRFWMKPAGYFHQWNAAGRIWAQMVGAMMNPEQLLATHYQLIDTSMCMFIGASQLVNEAMFPNHRIPTHPDIAQVADFVVALEERVYAIEDALVNVDDGNLKMAPGRVEEELERHLEYVEGEQNTLDTPDTPSSILQRTSAIGELAERLERVEGKLDSLLAAWEKIAAREYPEAV